MAIFYVDDNAVGANSGLNKTDAWTSIASSESVAAGSEIRVNSPHDELAGSAYNPDWVNATWQTAPIRIISVDFTDDSYASRGARIGTSSGVFTIAGKVEFYGMKLEASTNDLFVVDNPFESQVYHDCELKIGTGSGHNLMFGGNTNIKFVDCLILLGNSITSSTADGAEITFINSNLVNFSGATDKLVGNAENNIKYTFKGCDLTDWDNIISVMEGYAKINIVDCQLKSGFLLVPTSTHHPGAIITNERSHSDTGLTIPKMGLQEWVEFEGIGKSVLTQYRTGGADDGEQANAYSLEMITNANALEWYRPMTTPWYTRWVDGGSSLTLTFYVASGGTLNNDDFWIELFSPDEAVSATTLAEYKTSRMADPLATPAALTTDGSSTWNGTGVGTKQKVSITIIPTIAGPVKYRACLAKPSTTVYFDPRVEVT